MVMVGCTVALFGVNTLVTGQWSSRAEKAKAFGSEFPFDRGGLRDITFGNSRESDDHDEAGPLDEGEAETRGAGIAQSRAELGQMFVANLAEL